MLTRFGNLLLLFLVLSGCTNRASAVRRSEELLGKGTQQIQNNHYEVVVDSTSGRIKFFGRIGGANALWTNPQPDWQTVPFPGWKNFGGDKVWVWPEKDWTTWRGREGAPPGDPADAPYQVIVSGRTIRMTSPVIPGYGLRVIREINLDAESPRVEIKNTLEQVQASSLGLPISPWTVTQVPAPSRLYACLSADAAVPGYSDMSTHNWTPEQITARVLRFVRPAEPWQKVGLDATVLAAELPDEVLFTIACDAQTTPTERATRAQLFSNPDVSKFRPPGVGAYVELEFTAPVRILQPGQSATMTTVWQLHSMKGRDVAAILNDAVIAKEGTTK